MGFLGLLLELTKARITVFVTLSVATGYLLFAQRFDGQMVLAMAAVFLLACGSAALNQVQEWRLDAKMDRTRGRPIPTGRIAPRWALFVAFVLVGAGLYLLASFEHHAAVALGLGAFAVLWYNGVYLLLKRVTAFAVVPGALVGAIPPVIGWCAGGGVANDPAVLEVAFFFFLWQIPHFWLLALLYGPEYEAAGLPEPTRLLTWDQFRRITFVWVVALIATGIVLTHSVGLSPLFQLPVLIVSAWLLLSMVPLVRGPGDRKAALRAFLRINAYALTVMVVLSAHALLLGAAGWDAF